MPQINSPFFGISYGWALGEDGWGDPVNLNFQVMSYLDKGAVDDIVSSLPLSPTNGYSVILTTDNQIYVRFGSNWIFITPQQGMELSKNTDNTTWKFNGTSWIDVTRIIKSELANTADSLKGSAFIGRGIQKVSNIVALQALSKTSPSKFASTLGYYVAGDGGSGDYYLDVSDTTTAHNGGTVIVATDGGRWKLINQESVSLKQFGAKGDGVTDDTSAIQAALSSRILTLRVTRGNYVVTQKLTVTIDNYDSLSILGDGPGNTVIELNTGGDGLEVNLLGNWWLNAAGGKRTGLTISDITFATTNAFVGIGLSIKGVSVEGRPSEAIYLNRIRMRGRSNTAQFWATGIRFQDACPAWINSPDIHMGNGNSVSTGIEFIGTAQATSPVTYHVIHPEIFFGLYGIRTREYVEGVYITQPTIQGCQHGVYADPTTGESGLHLVGGHISAAQTGVTLQNMFDAVVSSCLIFRLDTSFEGFRGIRVFQNGRFSLTGNVIKGRADGTTETGILVESTIADPKYGGVVADNNISDFNGQGLWLSVNANYIAANNNNLRNCAIKVLRQDTNRNSVITGAEYSLTQVVTLTGGAASELINFTVPSGIFRVKPEVGICTCDGNTIVVTSYLYDDVATTETNLRFVVRNLAGGNIVGASYRLTLTAKESSRSTT